MYHIAMCRAAPPPKKKSIYTKKKRGFVCIFVVSAWQEGEVVDYFGASKGLWISTKANRADGELVGLVGFRRGPVGFSWSGVLLQGWLRLK